MYAPPGKTLSPAEADEIRIRVGDAIQEIEDEYGVNIIPSHPKREKRYFLYGIVVGTLCTAIGTIVFISVGL
ncbi:MAG: hypothetical protein PHQ81_03580 [Methanofollis sp.]|jgi:hypothetical protein|nr:hypothetical protein [Methanofollis sp.]